MMHARPWLDGKTNSAIMEIGSQKPMTAKHSQPQAMKKKDNNKKEITFYKCRKMGNYLNKRTNRKRSSFLVLMMTSMTAVLMKMWMELTTRHPATVI